MELIYKVSHWACGDPRLSWIFITTSNILLPLSPNGWDKLYGVSIYILQQATRRKWRARRKRSAVSTCNLESSSRNSGGHKSGRVDNPWPSLTKVGPKLVKISLSSTARNLLFWSSWPFNWSSHSLRAKEPSPVNISRALLNTYYQRFKNKKGDKRIIIQFKVLNFWEPCYLDGSRAILSGQELWAINWSVCCTRHCPSFSLHIVGSISTGWNGGSDFASLHRLQRTITVVRRPISDGWHLSGSHLHQGRSYKMCSLLSPPLLLPWKSWGARNPSNVRQRR